MPVSFGKVTALEEGRKELFSNILKLGIERSSWIKSPCCFKNCEDHRTDPLRGYPAVQKGRTSPEDSIDSWYPLGGLDN